MLKIKLARFGKKKQPCYRIIVNEAWTKRDGKYLANLGNYQPTKKVLVIDLENYQKYLKNGAQPTETVVKLVERFKSNDPFKKVKKKITKKEREEKKKNLKEESKINKSELSKDTNQPQPMKEIKPIEKKIS